MIIEHFFSCPYCGEQISMLLDLSNNYCSALTSIFLNGLFVRRSALRSYRRFERIALIFFRDIHNGHLRPQQR